MKKFILLLLLALSFVSYSQDKEKQIDLSEFTLSNISSPAFVLINESPSEIYVPENLKSLTIHTLNNLSDGLSIEVSPYYFLSKKSPNRSFFSYIGLRDEDGDGETKQNIFSGINTTSISFAYLKKDFTDLNIGERNVFSLGVRTKLIRLYNIEEAKNYYNKVSSILTKMIPPQQVIIDLAAAAGDKEKETEILNEYLTSKEGKARLKELDAYKKPIKPVFQVEYALGYSSLFQENNLNSETLNRFGTWLTAEVSLQLNKNASESKTNNYLNVFAISRYVEDGFNLNNTLFYRDFGTKVEFEFGKFSLGYEYISRNGSVDSERSVGSIKYVINKNVSINGGFGKDFEVVDNSVALFGINWALDFGSD